jgi:hypothetical protein
LEGNKLAKTITVLRNKLQNLLKKQLEKEAKLLTAEMEVEEYEAYMEEIRSLHKECSPTIDWIEMKTTPAPFSKGDKGPQEQRANNALENYKPGFFVKLFS